jgi:branched-chain amino acid transport system substrate-binding protein
MARQARIAFPGLVLILVGTLTACSSSGTKGTSNTSRTPAGSTNASAPSSAELGAVHKASGEPVKVGVITDGKGAAIDFSAELPAMQAAISYVNDYLGGWGGHPVQLSSCQDSQTAAGVTDCANKMIADGVTAVVQGQAINANTTAKLLAAAKIPYIIFASSTASILNDPNSVVLANSLGSTLGPALLTQTNPQRYRKTDIVQLNTPTLQSFGSLATQVWSKAGGTVSLVPIPTGTPDMTPQLQAALLKKPDAIHVVGDATFCASAFRALKSLDFGGIITGISYCLDATGELAGSSASKVYMYTDTDNTPTSPETQLFNAVMNRYYHGASDASFVVRATAYGVIVAVSRALKGYTGPVTSEGIHGALKAAKATPLPINPGVNFKCDQTESKFPSLCSTGTIQVTIDPSTGKPTGSQPVDIAPLLP